jgi:hypothetical protein
MNTAIDRGAEVLISDETQASAVSWSSIVAGAVAAAATSLILLALGAGFGFTSVSPWSATEETAATFGVVAAIWLVVVQWLSSGFGGYIAGRLRTKWVGIHDDEVFFRDTAHGLLTWALATVVTVALLIFAGSSIVGAGTRAAATVAGGAAQGAAQGAVAQGAPSMTDPTGYLLDTLFRPATPATMGQPATGQAGAGQAVGAQGRDLRAESARILAQGLAKGNIPDADRTYLSELVAAQTGLSVEDAQKRVDDVTSRARSAQTEAVQALDTARKAGAQLAFYTAFSLVIGAFVAAAAGAFGGRQRDYVYPKI